MSSPITDAELKKKLKKLPKAHRHDVWRELYEIGSFFALVGATEDALAVWRFAFSGQVPFPEKGNLSINVLTDAAISGVCFQLDIPDLTTGFPASRSVQADLPLSERVRAWDRNIRDDLTRNVWSNFGWENVPPEQARLANYRKARLLAHPSENENYSPTEEEALALLRVILNEQKSLFLHPFDESLGYLLAIDIAARHGQTEEATTLLNNWYDFSVENDREEVGYALGLMAVAALICNGGLASKTRLSAQARRGMVDTLVQEMTTRFSKPEPLYPAANQHTISVSHNQFYLEPLQSDLTAEYFQDARESDQGFSSFPGQCAICTPGDTMRCKVEIEFGDTIPPLDDAVQAVVLPISVRDDQGLFLRSVVELHNKYRVEIPKGDYDIVVRFFPWKQEKSERFDYWKVILTCLPKGTVGARCLKRDYGEPPSEVLLH